MSNPALILPEGWNYATEFLTAEQERDLLDSITTLPFRAAQYKEWTARRRVVSYGGSYDYVRNELQSAPPIAEFLIPLRERAAEWSGIPVESLNHAMIAEYQPGTPLGWHRDVPEFDTIIGISLAGHGRMRFRPYPPEPGQRTVFAIDLAPRSIYLMRGPARWSWQHAISPTPDLRYSITFRTRRQHVASQSSRGSPVTPPS